jgi:TonB family protein
MQGERVLTSAGRVALQWEAETGVLLTEESEAELRRLRVLEQEIGLWRGAVTAQVSRRREGQRFSVVADGVRARVMGTFFAVSLDETTVGIEVHEGKVRVESVEGRFPPLEVPAGMAVRVPRRGEDRRPALARTASRARPSQLNLLSWPSFQRVMAGTGLLAVESQPSGADVVFDTRAVGTTNLTLRGGLGRHLLELWRGGKLLRKQWVEIQLSPGRLALDITPRPRPAPRLPVAIQEVFRSRAVQIRACYERSLKNNPGLEGSLTLRLEVDASGQVARASLETDTLPDPRVGRCALTTVRRWHFPPGDETELVYPFKFRPR